MKLRFLEVSPSLSSFSQNLRAARRDRGFGRARSKATRWTTMRTTVRHISIPRREQQRLFPARSYIMYPPLTGRPAQSYCRLRRMDSSQLETTRDSWYYYTHIYMPCIRETL